MTNGYDVCLGIRFAFKLRRSKTRIEHSKEVSTELTYNMEQNVFIKRAVAYCMLAKCVMC